jgi:hypothetical protein
MRIMYIMLNNSQAKKPIMNHDGAVRTLPNDRTVLCEHSLRIFSTCSTDPGVIFTGFLLRPYRSEIQHCILSQ